MKKKNLGAPSGYSYAEPWDGKISGNDAKEIADNNRYWESVKKNKKAKEDYRSTVDEHQRLNSKTGGEYAARRKFFDDEYERLRKESDEADKDAINAYNEDYSKNESMDSAAAREDISDYFRDVIGNRKLPSRYNGGGIVRGYGKARGAKVCKVR